MGWSAATGNPIIKSASRYRAGHSLSGSVVCRRIDKAPSPSEQRRHGPAHVIIIIIVINIVVVMNCSEWPRFRICTQIYIFLHYWIYCLGAIRTNERAMDRRRRRIKGNNRVEMRSRIELKKKEGPVLFHPQRDEMRRRRRSRFW